MEELKDFRKLCLGIWICGRMQGVAIPLIRLPTAQLPSEQAEDLTTYPLGGRAYAAAPHEADGRTPSEADARTLSEADARTPSEADALTPRFMELLEEEINDADLAAKTSGSLSLREAHQQELRSIWQQGLYRQSILEAENERLRVALEAANQRVEAAAARQHTMAAQQRELEEAFEVARQEADRQHFVRELEAKTTLERVTDEARNAAAAADANAAKMVADHAAAIVAAREAAAADREAAVAAREASDAQLATVSTAEDRQRAAVAAAVATAVAAAEERAAEERAAALEALRLKAASELREAFGAREAASQAIVNTAGKTAAAKLGAALSAAAEDKAAALAAVQVRAAEDQATALAAARREAANELTAAVAEAMATAALEAAAVERERERARAAATAAAAAKAAAEEASGSAWAVWDDEAAAVQEVLGALPVYRSGSSAELSRADWGKSCGLSVAEVAHALYWIDARLRGLVSRHFPQLLRLTSTPLLCRETDCDRAHDLMQKRDSLLLFRDGQHGVLATLNAASQALGIELTQEEAERCRGAAHCAVALRELRDSEAQLQQLRSSVDAQARGAEQLAIELDRAQARVGHACVDHHKDVNMLLQHLKHQAPEGTARQAEARLSAPLDELDRRRLYTAAAHPQASPLDGLKGLAVGVRDLFAPKHAASVRETNRPDLLFSKGSFGKGPSLPTSLSGPLDALRRSLSPARPRPSNSRAKDQQGGISTLA